MFFTICYLLVGLLIVRYIAGFFNFIGFTINMNINYLFSGISLHDLQDESASILLPRIAS